MKTFMWRVGEDSLPVHIETRKNMRRMTIRMTASEIHVRCSPRTSQGTIRDVLEKNEQWLCNQRLAQVTRQSQFSIRVGGVLPIHNTPHTIRVTTSDDILRSDVAVRESEVEVILNSRERSHWEQELSHGLRKYAEVLLEELCRDAAARHGYQVNIVRIRAMRSRWGSCSSKRNVSLNWRLIFAPRTVLAYVIVHELAHLSEMNHSVRFWKRVEEMMPTYKESIQWLKEHGQTLFHWLPEKGESV